MCGEKIADDVRPSLDYVGFVEAIGEAELLHHAWHQFGGGAPAVRPWRDARQAAPFVNNGGA